MRRRGPAHGTQRQTAIEADQAQAVRHGQAEQPGVGNLPMAELLAASDYSQPQTAEEREWVDAPAVGRELI